MQFVRKIGKRYYGVYTLPGSLKEYSFATQTTNKEIAEERLRRHVREKEREDLGLIPPQLLRDTAQTSLETLLGEYLQDLTKTERDSEYIGIVQGRLKKLFNACGWKFLKEISSDSFIRWRNVQDLAPKTLNDYLGAASAFLHWLERNGRLTNNHLKTVVRVETRGKERRIRSTLSSEELVRLLEVSPRRAPIYIFAALTGIRRSEMDQLKWPDICLDDKKPYVTVRASTSKNKQKVNISLHPVVVAALRSIYPTNPHATPKVFRYGIPTVKTLQKDLAACGIKSIDEEGRVLDFHALRHTFCTLLQKSDVAPRIAMHLMRHSDFSLTMRTYTDTKALPLHSEIGKINISPMLTPKTGKSSPNKAFLSQKGKKKNRPQSRCIKGNPLFSAGPKMVAQLGLHPTPA